MRKPWMLIMAHKMKTMLLLVCCGAISINTYSQATLLESDLPELLPPAPDAASLIKVGLGSLNRSTGAVNAAIPLFELKMHSLSLPIALAYSSQGMKAEEACSRVGAGWALNAGGVVSRSIIGRADEFNNRATIPADLNALTNDNYYFFKNASNVDPTNSFDTQPDEFRFSFGNYSGKFVLDNNLNAVVIAHSNLKVNVIRSSNNIDEVRITTPDGTIYYFGGNDLGGTPAVEKTLNSNIQFKQFSKTAFFLYKIELLTGERVDFWYTPINTQSNVGWNESYTLGVGGGGTACGTCPLNLVSQKTVSQYVNYSTVYLDRITSSNGISMNFRYQSRGDATSEVKLTGLDIFDSQAGKIKEYEFEYYVKSLAQPASSAGLTENGLFFLTKVTEYDHQQEGIPNRQSLAYDLSYYDKENAGGSFFAQDHFGFANGYNSGTAIPYFPERPDRTGANKNPNWTQSVKGILQRITYPTGGVEEFTYEPNTIAVTEPVSTMKDFVISGGGVSADHHNYSTVRSPYVKTLRVVRTQTATITLKSFIRTNYTGTTYAPSSGTKVAFFTIRDLTTNQIVANTTLMGLQQVSDQVNFVAGHNYRMELQVRGPVYIHAHAITRYNYSATDSIVVVNKEASGVRVARITNYDPVDRKSVTKYFRYASLQNMDRSTGVGQLTAPYRSTSQGVIENGGLCHQICEYVTYSSNSAYNLFIFDNSHIYYTNIIESNDPSYANGGIEYTFTNPNNGNGGALIRGNRFPGIPTMRAAHMNGLVIRERAFDNAFFVQNEKISNYQWAATFPAIPAVAVKRNYSIGFTSPPDEWDFHPFDVIFYHHEPGWIRLESTITKTFDKTGEVQVASEAYAYGTPANANVQAVTTTNSRNETLVNYKKYATDFTGQAIPDLMSSKNIIDPVLEESITNNGVETVKRVTEYGDWFGTGKVIQPRFVYLKRSPAGSLRKELSFAAYDLKGNITEASKEGNTKFVYLWDSRAAFLIGKVDNATVEQVAYSSFEGNGADSWTVLAGAAYPAGGMTGSVSFSGTLTRSVPAGNYVVTLWSAGTAVTVNGATASPVVTKGNWKLFRFTLSSITSVNVAGSHIDEVRLYPENAHMTTYTYKPNIGIESQCDNKDNILYYTYDFFGRLIRIRDINQHIVKQFSYTYKGDVNGNCNSTAPDWVPTGKPRRCVKTANNNNTGMEEQEEIDRNNCSPTFLQVRWASLGQTGNCPVVPNCAGIDQRVINGQCATGWKVYTGEGSYDTNTGLFYCEYYYEWHDGYRSGMFHEVLPGTCNIS